MKPSEYPAGHYLASNVQIHIPPYQRPYEWDEDRWIDLWRDVAQQYRVRESGAGTFPAHFMGALIVEELPAPKNTSVAARSVIDGQQRLLTLFVLMAALRDDEAYRSKLQVQAVNELTTIRSKYSPDTFRLKPRSSDAAPMTAILEGDCVSAIPDHLLDSQIVKAYRFFRFQLWRGRSSVDDSRVELPPKPARGNAAPPKGSYKPWGAHASAGKSLDSAILDAVLTQGLKVLELELQPDDEESSVIFETMNSKSMPLRQFDLLRNSVFVRMPKGRDRFYSQHWEPLENDLRSISYSSLRNQPEDQFFYEYVISLGHDKVSSDRVHRRWLNAVIDSIGYEVNASSEKKFLKRHAEPAVLAGWLYPLAVGITSSKTVGGKTYQVTPAQHGVIKEILATSGGPPVPLILRSLIDYTNGKLPSKDLDSILNKIQSFLVRKILAGDSFSPLRAELMTASAMLTTTVTPQKMSTALLTVGCPDDATILSRVRDVQLDGLNSSNIFPILRGIERQLSGAGAHAMPFGSGTNEFSVEHVYPQTDNIGPGWEAELLASNTGRDDMELRRYVLGNLTAVTNYDNKRNGRKPFAQKKPLIAASAPLKLHSRITGASTWTPQEIDGRSTAMAKAALQHWPTP